MSLLDVAWGATPAGRALRLVLSPLEGAWRGVVGARNHAFDAGWRRVHATALPCLSVGNLTVGGTGKTPMAAFLAGRLQAAGARVAIVLRGYGGDEVEVHRLLTPGATVIANPDRVVGVAAARATGCDVAVLDDAFQHRRARRLSDVVLVGADGPWPTHCLPAGPLREPWQGLRRATLVVVTRKAVGSDAARAVAERMRGLCAAPVATVRLALDRLHQVGEGGGELALGALGGRSILAVAGVGNPRAVFDQLSQAGARVTEAPFPDHHPFDAGDVAALLRRAESAEFVVSTLKDAVKLHRLWPLSGPPLWYVSQRIDPEDGAVAFDEELRRVLAARASG